MLRDHRQQNVRRVSAGMVDLILGAQPLGFVVIVSAEHFPQRAPFGVGAAARNLRIERMLCDMTEKSLLTSALLRYTILRNT